MPSAKTPESPWRIPGLIRILHGSHSPPGPDLSLPPAGLLQRLIQIAEAWWEMKPSKRHLSEPHNYSSPGRPHPIAHALHLGYILRVGEFQSCRWHHVLERKTTEERRALKQNLQPAESSVGVMCNCTEFLEFIDCPASLTVSSRHAFAYGNVQCFLFILISFLMLN